MPRIKSVRVKLTPEQVQQLQPLYNQLAKDNEREPMSGGMIVAQVFIFESGVGGLFCRYLEHDAAEKVQEITNPENVGQMITYKTLAQIEEIFD